jgi:hypothetical protein
MAKPIPKSRTNEIQEVFSAKAQKKVERELNHKLMELDERSEERAQYVDRVLEVNDDSIREIVNTMVESLRKMEGAPKLTLNGKSYNTVDGETALLEKIQSRNFEYIAVRMLVACAKWDIRIGNFKLPKKFCADCGVKVK